tara:strand:+ start:4846 stop:5769 length:924 start_codon:yes stop_codon:yes gene_type:complete
MKKLFLLGLALVLFTSCKKEESRFTTASTNIDEVKALVADYNAGNWDAWATHYADTAKIFHNTWKDGLPPAELLVHLKGLLANTSSYGFDKEPVFYEQTLSDDGNTWVNFWGRWRGTLAANGQELTIPVHISANMKNGKIAEEYGYYDLSGYTAAMQQIAQENAMGADEKAMTVTIKAFGDIWNKNDIDGMKTATVENLVRNTNGNRAASNQTDYANIMNAFHKGFPDIHVAIDKTIIKDNVAYINWTVTGTNTGEFIGNPPTAKKITTHGLSVWTFNKDGKATQEDAFYDDLTLYNQLGIAPPTTK